MPLPFKKAVKKPWRPSVPRVLLIFRSNLKCLFAQQASVWNSKWDTNMKVVSARFSSAGPSSLLLWVLEIKLCLWEKSYGILKLTRPSTAEVKWGHKKCGIFAGVCEAVHSTQCSLSAPDVLCIDCISHTKTKTNEGEEFDCVTPGMINLLSRIRLWKSHRKRADLYYYLY